MGGTLLGCRLPIGTKPLSLKQAHVPFAAAKAANVDVVLVQQLQVEVAKGTLFLKDSMGLMFISAPGHDYGQVVTGMIGRVAKVTPQYHGGVVEQSSFPFLDLIHFKKEPVIVPEGIDLDATQLGDLVRLAAMVGQGMPTTGGVRHLDGPVDPVHGEGNDAGRVSPESQFRQFEQVPNLGGEHKLLIVTKRSRNLRFTGIEPKLFMIQLGFQFGNHGLVTRQLTSVGSLLEQLRQVTPEAIQNVLVILQLLFFRLRVLFLKKQLKNLLFIMQRGNGRAAIVPGTPPTPVVDAEIKEGETGVSTHLSSQHLIQ